MTEPLKPCECGRTRAGIEPFIRMIQVSPYRCVAACPSCPACTAPYPTEEAARAAWNRRAPVALPTRKEVAEVIVSGRYDDAASDDIADAILNLMRERMG